MTLRIVAAAATLAAAGCTSTPFSYIDGNKYFRTEINAFSVIVLDIDGVSRIQNPVMVTEFGPRLIRVQGPPPPGWVHGDVRTMTLDVKPCTRYYLKAVKQTRVQLEFEPAVDYEEPIPGCQATG